MPLIESSDKTSSRIGRMADMAFHRVETFAYIVLGVMLALAALVGIFSAGGSFVQTLQEHGDADTLVVMIDRLLFVLMIVEILHTVRASFTSGTLVSEPFLVVGLIASIRRVLVITLESSRANQPGRWSPDSQGLFDATMLELVVLGGLILVMVISIYMLRRSVR